MCTRQVVTAIVNVALVSGSTSSGSCYNLLLSFTTRVLFSCCMSSSHKFSRSTPSSQRGRTLSHLHFLHFFLARTAHAVTCNVTESACDGGNMWYAPGYVSPRSGCCHCQASCENVSDSCSYYDAVEQPQDNPPSVRRMLETTCLLP